MVILGKSAGKSKRVEPHPRFGHACCGCHAAQIAPYVQIGQTPVTIAVWIYRGTRGERGGISQNRVAERPSGECPVAPSTCFFNRIASSSPTEGVPVFTLMAS